jgi:tetratricopeptide (TPR) repeat protein
MEALEQMSVLRHIVRSEISAAYFVPVVAGSMMIAASLLPWLKDPLGAALNAWKLPIFMGWQLPASAFNYGLLCLCCAGYCFFLAYANWQASRKRALAITCTPAALLCLLALGLFFLQYLSFDLPAMNLLAQHTDQVALMQGHFGYGLVPELLPMKVFGIDITTVPGRFQLLLDSLQVGVFLPALSAWILFDVRRHKQVERKAGWQKWTMIPAILLFLLMLGRAAGWSICEGQAQAAIAEGNYSTAIQWLDRALFFNPSLEQVLFYHIERGEALYYAHPMQQSDDSQAYVASTLIGQHDYRDAYQQLFSVWQAHKTTPWVADEMSTILEHLAESAGPARVIYLPQSPRSITQKDGAALPWLQVLVEVDPDNVYAHYLIGRIDYDLKNYALCNMQLETVLRLSSNTDIQSSAYTYMALSEAGMGNFALERTLLLQAEQLDPEYRNITAREELSGLR